MGLVGDFEGVGHAGAQGHRLVTLQGLVEVDLAPAGAVLGVVAHDLGLGPGGVEVVLDHLAAMGFGAEHQGVARSHARMGRGDREDQAEFLEHDGGLGGQGVTGDDTSAVEFPVDLQGGDVGGEFLVAVDQVRLVVTEVVGAGLGAHGDLRVLAVEGRGVDLAGDGELGDEGAGLLVGRPVEDAGHVREGQRIREAMRTGRDQRQDDMQAGGRILIGEQALLLARGLVEGEEAADRQAAGGFDDLHRAADGLREARPLGEVTGRVEIGHAGGVARDGVALGVADDDQAVLGVEERGEKVGVETTDEVAGQGFLVDRHPAVPQGLEEQGDAVHLAVGADAAAVGPAQPVFPDGVHDDADVFLGQRAELRQLGVAELDVGVQLERLADEDQRDDAVQVEGAAEVLGVRGLGGFVLETARGSGGDAIHETVDQRTGLILLGQAEGEATDRLGDVEGLDVVVMVVLDGEAFVDQGTRGFVEDFPDRVTFAGRAEREEAEAGEGHAIVGAFADADLGGDRPGDDLGDVLPVEVELPGGAEIFPEGEGGVAGLIGPRDFPVDRHDSAIG